MSSNLIKQPYEMILDPTGGGGRAKPVANGKFYVGEIDKDPIANPRTDIAYKDESGQERSLTSPLTLNNSGAFVVSKNDGTIIQPYMKDGIGFSVLIQDSRGRDVYSDLSTGDPGNITSIVSNRNLITNSLFSNPGSVANHPDATPRSYSAGDEVFQGVYAVSNISGVTYINESLDGVGQLYVDIYKTEKQKLSTAEYIASIASSNLIPSESGASFIDNGDYWRVTFDMKNTFSVKFERGISATSHMAAEEESIVKVKPLGSAPYVSVGVRGRDFYRVEDYSHLVSGGIWDDAIHKCIDDYQYNQNASEGVERAKLVFPAFTAGIHSVQINDLYDTEIDFNGCLLKAIATSNQTSAFGIKNYKNIKLANLGAIYSANNPLYTYGMLLSGGGGGTIDPDRGLGIEAVISNSLILRFARGLKIGNELIDTNHGQNSLIGVHVKECNQGLIGAGSQTIISATGGTFGSGGKNNYGIADVDKLGVITLGAAITLNSTGALKASGGGYGYGVSNCLSDAFNNQYGAIVHNGSYVETVRIARIFKTPKQDGSSFTPSSAKSALILSNVTGGVSGANDISIVCNDNDYAGVISLKDSNIYGFGGSRTAPAIDVGDSNAEVDLGRRFFRKPFFKSNLEEVVGGIMCLDNDLISRAESLSGQTITTAGDVLKFQTILQTGRFDRFKNMYTPSTGILTVPKGGFTQMTIEVGISSNTFSGVVRVLVNGVAKYNFYTSLRMDLSTTLYDLDEGDEVSVKVEPSSSVTFGSLSTDYMQITATR
ncbi:tailspike protein [Vibrio phage 1.036.O._10N.286.45.C3]|nr:tailspike protein [Vibrio phage 1.036.O._10N.286.45.C3]